MSKSEEISEQELRTQNPDSSNGESTSSSEQKTASQRRSRYTAEAFLNETDNEERTALSSALESVLLEQGALGRSVYLEGLGIFSTRERTQQVIRRLENGRAMLIREHQLRAVFEKCGELVSFHRSHHQGLLETKDLADLVCARLPIDLQHRWTYHDLKRILRGFSLWLRGDVLNTGIAPQLKRVGVLFSLHNRQGKDERDWFAGADIFLASAATSVTSARKLREILLPEFESAWEPFGAIYGEPFACISLPLASILDDLSLKEELGTQCPAEIKVMVFRRQDSNQNFVTYVSDGLRHIAKARYELVWQARVDLGARTESIITPICPNLVAEWPQRILALGALLVLQAKHPRIAVGSGLSIQTALWESPHNNFHGVLSSEFSLLPGEQSAIDGPFRYLALTPITNDESLLAEQSSPAHVLTLLRHRGLDQCSPLVRPTILGRSIFATAH